MKKPDFKDILEKYAAGKCTDEERALLEGWYLSQLKNGQRPSAEQLAKVKEEMWNELSEKSVVERYSVMRILKWSAVAAALAAAVLFTYKLDWKKGAHSSVREQSALAAPGKAEVKLLKASDVENTMMKLPDGSMVILAKGSSLTLFSDFNGASGRKVRLEGKAYFDIAHDPSRPFIIHTGNVLTRVLGTAFDITTSAGSKTVKVNVIRGKVEVKNTVSRQVTYLHKDMQLVFGEDNRVTLRQEVNAEQELAWRQQDLEFNDISLEDAVQRLEEQFGYKIVVNDPDLRKQKFTYSMRSNESPDSFMKSFCEFLMATYSINKELKTISIQPLKPTST
ncbi:FecR family protein [Pedobacter deserti]|uniref:FecR family protein n=1 Tax=Pedobacter deserti TaxID=2817382 RepID=UPI002109FE46|nr:FecR domain-containing protein [Pedobacter sp. SYSU D00382]